MAEYTKQTDRMDFEIDEVQGTILITLKWKYTWQYTVGATYWTHPERRSFHDKVNQLVANSWGEAFFLKAVGSSDFVTRNLGREWDVNFHVEWVESSEHWNAKVRKLARDYVGAYQSAVYWGTRIIKLDSNDTSFRSINGGGVTTRQSPLVHEFGHAIGNSRYSREGMHGDEYPSSSVYAGDRESVMNAGNTFRNRHADYIIYELNTIVPQTIFVY